MRFWVKKQRTRFFRPPQWLSFEFPRGRVIFLKIYFGCIQTFLKNKGPHLYLVLRTRMWADALLGQTPSNA